MHRRLARPASALVALVLVVGGLGHAHAQGTAVVELFTSQGCSSCPPADAVLGELADEPGVIALSLHVDYWDDLGWTDPFGDARWSARQRRYASQMGRARVYTPQVVIEGRRETVGHAESTIRSAIANARERGDRAPARFVGDGPEAVIVDAGDIEGHATVHLARYDERHTTRIERGENAGRTLVNHHVVRWFERLGRWSGERERFAIDAATARRAGRDGLAVIVQRPGPGKVLGAAATSLTPDS